MKKTFILSILLAFLLCAVSVWATVSSSTSRVQYNCNGSLTGFAFTFNAGSTDDVKVILTDSSGGETTLTETTNYTVSCTNNDCSAGGTVTTVSTYASGYTITLLRDVDITQESDFTENQPTLYETFEDGLDKLTRIAQDHDEQISRSIKVQPSSTVSGSDLELNTGNDVGGRVIGWDSAGTALTTYATSAATSAAFAVLSDYDDLSAAITAIGAGGKTLVVDRSETISENISIPDNIKLLWIDGNLLTIATGYTLTMYSPDHIIADIRSKLFVYEGTGVVSFTYPGRMVTQWWGSDNNETSVSDEAALNAAITAAAAGSTIYLPGGSQYYKLTTTDLTTIDKTLTFEGDGESSEIRQTASHGIFDITASNVTIRNLKLYGKQSIAAATNENAIMAYGADKDNYISHVNLENVWIENWGYRGLKYTFVENFTIKDVYMEDIWIAGMSFSSSRYGSIDGCTVRDMTNTAGNAWNYICTRTEDDSIDNYPRCKDITFTDCKAYDNELWAGFDTHAGDGIKWVGCVAYNCKRGIDIGAADNGSSVGTFAPLNCSIIGGTLESAVTGTASPGISITGAAGAGGVGSPTELAKGIYVAGVTVKGYGAEDTALSSAIYLRTTVGLVLNGLNIVEASPIGILVYYDNYGFSIRDGSITDTWSDTAKAYGIEVNADYNYGTISGVSFTADDKSDDTPTYLNERAIQIGNNAHQKIIVGSNYSEYDLYLRGTLTYVSSDTVGGTMILKQIYTYSDFSVAAASKTVDFTPNIPPGAVVTDVWWTLDEVFAGGSCSAATLSIGPTANDDGFIVDTNVFTGASTGYQTSDVTARGDELYDGELIQYFTTAATTLRASLEIVDDTIDNLTSGQATFWVRYYKIN